MGRHKSENLKAYRKKRKWLKKKKKDNFKVTSKKASTTEKSSSDSFSSSNKTKDSKSTDYPSGSTCERTDSNCSSFISTDIDNRTDFNNTDSRPEYFDFTIKNHRAIVNTNDRLYVRFQEYKMLKRRLGQIKRSSIL